MFLIEGAVMTADGLEWLAETSALSKKYKKTGLSKRQT